MRSEEEIKREMEGIVNDGRERLRQLKAELAVVETGFNIGDVLVRDYFGVTEEFEITGFGDDGISDCFVGDLYRKGCCLEEPGTWRKKNG